MNNYNAKSKLIRQNQQNVFGIDNKLVDMINAAIMGQESPLNLNDFDVYVDDNFNVYVVDMRNTNRIL